MAGPKPHLSNPRARKEVRQRQRAYARADELERRELDRVLRQMRLAEDDAAP